MEKQLIKKLEQYGYISKYKIERASFETEFTGTQFRDVLLNKGLILEENRNDNTYVVSIKAGFANRNNAIIAVCFSSGMIIAVGYAQEGLINQHTAEKAIKKLIEALT